MDTKEKIYIFGLAVLDELLQQRNVSKRIKLKIEESRVLSDMIHLILPHVVISFSEQEIVEFYQMWAKEQIELE